jgi:NADH-quinone oxidoreductase subunit J
VLFLFVVMMLDIDLSEMRAGFMKYLPLGLGISAIMVVELLMVVGPANFGLDKYAAPAAKAADFSNTEALGTLLYTEYLYPFEIAAVILLVAIIAAISLTLRKRPETKYQDPSKQVSVKKEHRLRIIKMEAEE